jgi:hypothetical protein
MSSEFKLISNTMDNDSGIARIVPSAKMQRHFRNVMDSVLQDALDAWGDIWTEFQGTATHGHLVSENVKDGFTPDCGWPEFLEKMWLLRHYIDYAKRFCDWKQ